jgi:hypothetical protein
MNIHPKPLPINPYLFSKARASSWPAMTAGGSARRSENLNSSVGKPNEPCSPIPDLVPLAQTGSPPLLQMPACPA